MNTLENPAVAAATRELTLKMINRGTIKDPAPTP
jgi:hypothetical protein